MRILLALLLMTTASCSNVMICEKEIKCTTLNNSADIRSYAPIGSYFSYYIKGSEVHLDQCHETERLICTPRY